MKKRVFSILIVVIALLITSTVVLADKPTGFDSQGNETKWADTFNGNGQVCTKIQDGVLYTSDGELLTTGFSDWGYNYQGHIFNGAYCDYHPVYRPGGANHEWCMANYGDVDLVMKWNDAWLSNVDCTDDGLLDRHYGLDSYIGSGAWTTNHMWGSYMLDGQTCNWDYFVKIIAAPADATLVNGVWYAAGGTEIGPAIWGSFAIIQEFDNDPCSGGHILYYQSPDHTGFGGW